ncbi:MAG: tetratricopeptide repeat protein [Deltaproteobacteria bacterium]|nr:tetratricopeptide repeat protein [Deltaproteobacteria bacterium]
MESIHSDDGKLPGKTGENPSASLSVIRGNARTYYKKGNASFQEGQYESAIACFTKAIELNPRDERAYNNRGSAHVGRGEYDAAISDFTKAIEINPRYARAYHNRGVAYACIGANEMAELDNGKAFELDSRYAQHQNAIQQLVSDSKGQRDGTLPDVLDEKASKSPHPATEDDESIIESGVSTEQEKKENNMQNIDTPTPAMSQSTEISEKKSGKSKDKTGESTERSVKKSRGDDKPKSTATPMVETLTPVHHYTLIFSLLVLLALLVGWQRSASEYIVPEEGLGYNLGIIGGAMMLLLLLYPLRKTARFMRNWGANKYWFWAHMVFGIMGPVLILFHSNFHLGSFNSRVALMVTLIVSGSGIVGRYIYTRIHYGLYGREMTLKGLQDDISTSRSSMVFGLDYAPKLKERLLSFETKALKPHHGLLHSIWFILATGISARWTHMALRIGLRRVLKVTAKRAGWSAAEAKKHRLAARNLIAMHIKAVIRASYFGFYERLFALWHVFHFPCFLLLVIVAVVHVLAVHMY